MSSLLLGSLDLTAGPYEAQVGSSMGSWASITTAVTSLFLDGSVVSGEATANRQITLQVFVNATTQAALTAACEALIGEANKPSNTLTWTPDGGVPIVYEVFRTAGPVQTDAPGEFQLFHIYQLVFPALPFARSATRESPAASAPAVTLDDFNTSFTGGRLQSRFAANPWSGPYLMYWTCPVGDANTVPIAAMVTGTDMNAALTVVTNCTVAYSTTTPRYNETSGGSKTTAAITATAAGLAEVRTTASWTVTGDMVTVAVNIGQSFPASQLAQAGVEWLDAGSASIRVDWGTPMASGYGGSLPTTVWAVSKVPATAVKVRVRLRVPAATAGQVITAVEIAVVPSTLGTVPVGSGEVVLVITGDTGTMPPNAASGYLYRGLPAAKNVSAVAALLIEVLTDASSVDLGVAGMGTLSVRLFDSTGRWSRYWFTGTNLPYQTWTQLAATLAAPYMSSAAGAVNLTDVVAYDLDTRAFYGTAYLHVRNLGAGPAPAPYISLRGTVLNLSPIVGSARTTASVTVSSGSALGDWLVAAIDGTTGPPLLAVAASVATVAAPAGYDGVYSVLGCLSPATVLATPTCTIVQKNAGVTVATRVLTGTTRTGNRYVDFGAVELPLVATPPENLGVSYTFTLAPSSASWVEVLVIDVDASLAWVDSLVTSLPVGWVDEPDIVAGLGKVWVGTATDRSDAQALAQPLTMSRPLQVKAPSTRLLVYSTTIAPNVMLTYWPRWLVEPS